MSRLGGDSSVMGLRALHRHCRMPATAAALLSVLLYTALVASHVVSQATPLVLIGAQVDDAQGVAAGDPGCHELLHSAGNANDSHRGLPASPAKKCPFCAGYAGLHVTVARRLCGRPTRLDCVSALRGRRQRSAGLVCQSSRLALPRSPNPRLIHQLQARSERGQAPTSASGCLPRCRLASTRT